MDEYGVRFILRHERQRVLVVVTHEALHKAEGALTSGPVDQDEFSAFARHRPLFEEIAVRKLTRRQVEENGAVRITTMDLSSLGV